jgi:hypothetical protein
MLLAEALVQRADLQRRIEQLRERLARNLRVQEGEEPAEQPEELWLELCEAATNFAVLVQRINRTNAETQLDGGYTLSDALADRDWCKSLCAVCQDVTRNASVLLDRYSRTEIKTVSTVNVAEWQQRADDYARKLRELDLRIQALNWKTELLD